MDNKISASPSPDKSGRPAAAAMLAIGDELLSGRTKDKNIAYMADELTKIGIDLREVRIVADDEADIIAAVNALRARYDYVFTSGGIGPTHDDITAESIAKAFNLPCIFDARAEKILLDYYKSMNSEMTEGRRLMTRMPEGAQLIANSVSGAPGFIVENCFIMAGVPQIFQAMVQAILPHLKKSAPMQSVTIACSFGESRIAAGLAAIQKAFPQTSIGSYPQMQDDKGRKWAVSIVIRSREAEARELAAEAVKKMLDDLRANS